MNDNLLENPQVAHGAYFEDLVKQLHHLKHRISKVLHVGLSLEAQSQPEFAHEAGHSVLSLALIEEIELITAVLAQVFEHADYWTSQDSNTFKELKDYTLFAVAKLLQHCIVQEIIPASTTEKHLAKVNLASL